MKTEVGNFLALRQVLYHLYTEMFGDLQERFEMTQMEINILLFLANNPQFDTAAELVSACKLAKSQVSTAVDNLVNRGYLSRQLEGRRIHLCLLPAAESVIREGRLRQETFRDAVLVGFSQEERAQLNDLMNRIVTNARTAERQWNEGKINR